MISIERLKELFDKHQYVVDDDVLWWTYYNIQKIIMKRTNDITALGLLGPTGAGKTRYVQVYKEILSEIFDNVKLITFCPGLDSLDTIISDDEDNKNKSIIDKSYLSEVVISANEGNKVILFIDNYNEDNKATDNFLNSFIEYGTFRISENKTIKLEDKNNLQIIIARNTEIPFLESLQAKLNTLKFERLTALQITEYIDSLDIKCNEAIKYLILFLNYFLMINTDEKSYWITHLPSIPELIKAMENVQFLVESKTDSSLIFNIVYESLVNSKMTKETMIGYKNFGYIHSIFQNMMKNGEFNEYKVIDMLLGKIKESNYDYLDILSEKIKQSALYIKREEEKKLEKERQKILKLQKEKEDLEQQKRIELEKKKLQEEKKQHEEEERKKEEEARKISLVEQSSKNKNIILVNKEQPMAIKSKFGNKFDNGNWQYTNLIESNIIELNNWYKIVEIKGAIERYFSKNYKKYIPTKESSIIFEYFNKETNIYNNRLILCHDDHFNLTIYSSEPVISYLAIDEILKILSSSIHHSCYFTLPVLSLLNDKTTNNMKYDPNYPNVSYFEDGYEEGKDNSVLETLTNLVNELKIIQNKDSFIIPVYFRDFSSAASDVKVAKSAQYKVVSVGSGIRQLRVENNNVLYSKKNPLYSVFNDKFSTINVIYNSKVKIKELTRNVYKLLSNPQFLKKELLSKGIYIVNEGTKEETILINPYEAFIDNDLYEQRLIETNTQLIKKINSVNIK